MVARKRPQIANPRPAHLVNFQPDSGLSAKQWGDELMAWADARNLEAFGSMEAAREYHQNNWPASTAVAPSMIDEIIEAVRALDAEAQHGRP